jgi:tetratricopeptide (TPR) repeat protein
MRPLTMRLHETVWRRFRSVTRTKLPVRTVVACVSMSNAPRLRACLATSVVLGVLWLATPASALTQCEGYAGEELSTLAPAERIAWLTEELAQCDHGNEYRAVTFYNRGRAHYELGNFETALPDFEMALGLDAEYSDAYYGRAYAYYNLGRYEEAIADFDRAIARDPGYVDGYAGRASAVCLSSEPRSQAALDDILTLVQMDPQRAMVWQSYLLEQGYFTGPVDGNFDEASQAAFIAWCDA